MIKGIIFDLDGTLLNTIEDINNALNLILENNGFPKRTIKQTKLSLGSGSFHLIRTSLPKSVNQATFLKIHAEYQRYYQNNNDILTRPYDGILDAIKELRANGYKLAVVSNKDDHDVKLLNQNKFQGLIDIAIGARKEKPVKPDPYLVRLALDEMKLTADEVVYVGDSDIDILTAKNANIPMITVTWGFRDLETLERCQATNIIDNPEDIIKKVKLINDQINKR
ncbi:MAG TPA: HAD family hydrolase [Acholeplasmataceae bacterium]|jgi:phosphoglycolate phosphatase|nr:HAD family hydrolase [Acholeplasmataceae bacterium]HQC30536.1 HAD family hydrolase [Acholeplasmataceae bacterium]